MINFYKGVCLMDIVMAGYSFSQGNIGLGFLFTILALWMGYSVKLQEERDAVQ